MWGHYGVTGAMNLTATGKVWRDGIKRGKFTLLWQLQSTFSSLKSTKVVVNMQETWHSPNMAHTMVHGQVFLLYFTLSYVIE